MSVEHAVILLLYTLPVPPLILQFKAFRFPKQTNQLAFVFDPAELGLSLSFGVEVFEPGHHTPLHVHRTGHELFFVLAGKHTFPSSSAVQWYGTWVSGCQ
jgi:hypothetical protein